MIIMKFLLVVFAKMVCNLNEHMQVYKCFIMHLEVILVRIKNNLSLPSKNCLGVYFSVPNKKCL